MIRAFHSPFTIRGGGGSFLSAATPDRLPNFRADTSRTTPSYSGARSRWISELVIAGDRTNPICCCRSTCDECTLRPVDAAPPSEPPGQVPPCPNGLCQWHVVNAGSTPGVAAQHARQRHPSPAPQPEACDRFVAIDRTSGQMTAVVADQGR